jgi:glucokinase
MSTSAYIGIDLGGTNVRAGAVTAEGKLLRWRDTRIEARQGPAAGLERIANLIEQVRSEAAVDVKAIGIGSTGPLDRQRGAIQNPYTLPTWEDVDIASPLRARFNVPVTLENDADAAALGEAWLGAGRGVERMLMVTVGTGIGTAFIQNGQIYRGMDGIHPEGGHIPIDPSGPQCYCGAKGCWESLASGPAIGAYAREITLQSSTSLLAQAGNDPEKIDAALVARAAREGDRLARQVVEHSAAYLALGLVNVMQLFVPDCVILTGGVMRSFDLFEPHLRKIITQHSIMSPLDKIPLRLAVLDQQAGIFGAARAAWLEAQNETDKNFE